MTTHAADPRLALHELISEFAPIECNHQAAFEKAYDLGLAAGVEQALHRLGIELKSGGMEEEAFLSGMLKAVREQERERCAQIAGTHIGCDGFLHKHGYNCASRIAAAIRAAASEQPEVK